MSPWLNFVAVIGAELLCFLVLVYQKRAFKTITLSIVLKSITVGAVIGIPLELLLGKYFGGFSHPLNFEPVFMVVNGAFSWGVWFLTLWLLRQNSFLSFCAWTTAIGLVYEVANYFYPVWLWTFNSSFLFEELVVVGVGYCGGAILVAWGSSFATQTKFRAFTLK